MRSFSVVPLPSVTTSSSMPFMRMPLSRLLPKTSGLPCSRAMVWSSRTAFWVSVAQARWLKMLQVCGMSRSVLVGDERVGAHAAGAPHPQLRPRDLEAGGHRGRPAVDGVEAVRVHVVREAAGAADAGDDHEALAGHAQLREHGLDGEED